MIELLISLPMILLGGMSVLGLLRPKYRGICAPLLIGSVMGVYALTFSIGNAKSAIYLAAAIDTSVALWLATYAFSTMREDAMLQAVILGCHVLAHALLDVDVVYMTNFVYYYYEFLVAFLTLLQCYLLRGVFGGILKGWWRDSRKCGGYTSGVASASAPFTSLNTMERSEK